MTDDGSRDENVILFTVTTRPNDFIAICFGFLSLFLFSFIYNVIGAMQKTLKPKYMANMQTIEIVYHKR